MDTRNKIVELANVRQDKRPLKLIIGYFDPLHASQIRRLEKLDDGESWCVVAIADPPLALLSLRARAELVASLRLVDQVVTDAENAIRQLSADEVVDERESDARGTEELRRRVIVRHDSA